MRRTTRVLVEPLVERRMPSAGFELTTSTGIALSVGARHGLLQTSFSAVYVIG
jgi:hypothetical protein